MLEMKSCLSNVGDFKSFGLWLSVTEMTAESFARGEGRERKRQRGGVGWDGGRKRGGGGGREEE